MRPVAAGAASQPIITPEAVPLELERAGVASRTLAITLDLLAFGAALLALVLVLDQLSGDSGAEEPSGGVIAVMATGFVLLIVAWFCGFETLWRGRTLGKAAMGLRVVGADGSVVRFHQAFLRAAVGIVDFLLVPIGFIAVVSVLLSRRDQRLGDLAAGTLVVRERSASRGVAPAWFAPPPGWERYAASLDVTALDAETYGVVRSFLLRVPTLASNARDHLAVRLANHVAVRIGHVPPAYVHPHLFLQCVAANWQRTHAAGRADAGRGGLLRDAPPPPR